jgi:hypothetical protein
VFRFQINPSSQPCYFHEKPHTIRPTLSFKTLGPSALQLKPNGLPLSGREMLATTAPLAVGLSAMGSQLRAPPSSSSKGGSRRSFFEIVNARWGNTLLILNAPGDSHRGGANPLPRSASLKPVSRRDLHPCLPVPACYVLFAPALKLEAESADCPLLDLAKRDAGGARTDATVAEVGTLP